MQEAWCDGVCIAAEEAKDANCNVTCGKDGDWETQCFPEDAAVPEDAFVKYQGAWWAQSYRCYGYWWCY